MNGSKINSSEKMNREKKSDGTDVPPYPMVKLLQQEEPRKAAEKPPFLFSKRFLVVILIFFGNFNIVLLKSNLNIAIVEMTTKKKTIVGNLITYQPEFDWDSKTVGLIQSAFAYGYLFSAIGAPIVSKLGGSVSYGMSILAIAIINLITPASLYANFILFLAFRIVIGVLDGVSYMGFLELLSRWAPVQERSTMMSLCCCGVNIAVAVSYPICGLIAYRWGWPMVFYVSGIEGIIWSTTWLITVKNQPSNDKRISKEELLYLIENTETIPRNEVVHPYKKIFTSPAVWALCAGKLAYSWGITLLITCFPLYIKDMTGRSTDEIGIIASIPNFVCIITIPLCGFIVDYWQNNSSLKVTQIHKIIMGTGFISGSIFFLIASYSTNFTLSMACFTFIKFIVSFNSLILQLVCLYMSSIHSSILGGVSAFWFTMSVLLVPTTVGFIVQNHSLEEWSKCFLLSAAVLFCGAIIFLVYGSSEIQEWSMKLPMDTKQVLKESKIENKKPCAL